MAQTLDDLAPADGREPEHAAAPPRRLEADLGDDDDVELPAFVDRFLDRLTRISGRAWVTFLVVGAATLYVLFHLHPEWIYKDTTPTGGDMGSHVWAPAYLRDHILPHWRLAGWAPDWYAGFPMYHFYMVVPALAVVLVDLVLPYGAALKLVSASGMLTLPLAAYLGARIAGWKFPGPQLAAVVAVVFLWDETFTIYGGNVASTMAGEFSFSIALSLSVVYFGVLARGLHTGRHRALAAVLLALTGLCHLLVAFFGCVGTLVWWLLYADKARSKWVLTTVPVTGLLVAFWMLPFWWQRLYMTDMGYEKELKYLKNLFPQTFTWDVILNGLGIVGIVFAVARRRRVGLFWSIMTLVYAAWFRLQPQGHLWNTRLLPFFYLSRYTLAAYGVYELANSFAVWVRPVSRRLSGAVLYATPFVGLFVVVGLLGMAFRDLPFGHEFSRTTSSGTVSGYKWLGFEATRTAFTDDWAKWNYTGYEGKDGYGEYYAINQAMKRIGAERGCGRAHWEYDAELNKYGTTMSMMLLPFWTDGCIGSMEGLYFESSATTPYHFLTAAAVSKSPSRPVRGLTYDPLDLAKGVPYMQLTGVKYYMAFSPEAIAQADAQPDLTFLEQSGPWRIYEVAGSELVEPLVNEPYVVRGIGDDRQAWLDNAEAFFLDPSRYDLVPAASGPSQWQRIDAGGLAERRALEPVTVSGIDERDDRISFRVDKVGVPVLVKVSYFPNWEASGAKGPWRVAPNLMVVVPTRNEVSLHYGRTGIDILSTLMTLAGVALVVVLARKGAMALPPPVARRRRRDTAAALDVAPAGHPNMFVDPADGWADWGPPPPGPPDGEAARAWAPPPPAPGVPGADGDVPDVTVAGASEAPPVSGAGQVDG